MKNNIFIIFLIILVVNVFEVYGQRSAFKNDTVSINYLLNKADSLGWNNPDSMLYYANKALVLSKQIGNVEGIINSYLKIASAEYVNGNYSNGLDAAKNALTLANQYNLKKYLYHINNSIGLLYQQIKKDKESIYFFRVALEHIDSVSQPAKYSAICNNLANSYFNISDFKNMNKYRQIALRIRKRHHLISALADTYNDIGIYFLSKKQLDTSEKCFITCYKIKDSIGDLEMMAESLLNLASIYIQKKELNKAEELLFKGKDIAIQLSAPYYLKAYLEKLLELYELKKDHLSQNNILKQLIHLKDSLYVVENTKQLNRLFTEFETEKKDLEIRKLKDLQQEIDKRHKLTLVFITIIVFFLLIFLIFYINRYKIITKQKLQILQQNEILEQNYIELQQKNKQIQEQKAIIEQKNKDIVDSITYAKRIQQTLLPNPSYWRSLLPNSFVFYLPKDIVAGDFYWLAETADYVFIAVADCTGHGVPGAMVSITCHNALNRVVLEEGITNTNAILDKTREIVVQQLHTEQEGQLQDGMDICLVRIDKANRLKIQYSGANRPLIIISDGQLKEYKADKQPIGYFERFTPFSYYDIKLSNGSCLYLFTDGFVDQFGGERNKKLGTKKWKELLLEIYKLPMNEQFLYLKNFFYQWKKEEQQVDDVTVLGLRV